MTFPASLTASEPHAHRDELNGVDALITAGRTLASHWQLILPWALLLEAIKVVVLLALVDQFGEETGGTIAGLSSGLLLLTITALSTRLALDVAAGRRPDGAIDLMRRTLPTLPLLLAVIYVPRSLAWLDVGPGLFWLIGTVGLLVTGPALIAGLPLQRAVRATWEMPSAVEKSWMWLVAMFVFLAFSLELIPALADSTVGRKAELSLWITTESIYSTVLTPLWSLTIAFFYVQLAAAARTSLAIRKARAEAEALAPAAQDAPPTGLQPVAPGISSTTVLRGEQPPQR